MSIAEFTSTKVLAAEFEENGEVYVGNLQVEDTIALIRELRIPADQLRVDGGVLRYDELAPKDVRACAATFESITSAGVRQCQFCKLPAFMHRAVIDPVVIA